MHDAPQDRRRPRREVWVFPETVRRYKERRAASPPPRPGYLCEQCQDAPAVQCQAGWQGEPFLGVKLADSTWTRERGDRAPDALAQWQRRARYH